MKPLYKYFLVLSLLLFSCSKDTINTPPIEEEKSNSGSLNFHLDKANAPAEVAYVKIILTRPDQPDITGTMDLKGPYSASLILKDILEGPWHILVEAYNDLNILIYDGEADVVVKRDDIVYLTIILDAVNGKVGIIDVMVIWGPPSWKDYGAVLESNALLQANGVVHPEVLFNDGKFMMWYSGMNNANTSYLFYAESPDGVHWKPNPNSVFVKSYGEWDSYSVGNPKVVKVGFLYYMFYRGERYTYSNWNIGHAYSSDGIDWTRRQNPVIYGTTDDHFQLIPNDILYVNNKYYLFYSASNNFRSNYTSKVYLATSTDGVSFTPGVEVLRPTLTWEDKGIYQASIIYDSSKFKMVYNDYPSGKYIGYAESYDGINWYKNENPIYNVNETKDNWVSTISNLSFLNVNGRYSIYYSGLVTGQNIYKIGLLRFQ